MNIIGLTGSIGMGKSTVASMFAEAGAPAFDSDAAVHALYAAGGAAVAPVEAAFPGVTKQGAIDRAALSARVVGDAAAIKRLEAIVHPLVRESEKRFLGTRRGEGHRLVLVDIPLLFETDRSDRVDVIVVVTASSAVQRERVLARSGMTEEKLKALLARQMPDEEKRRRAHFLVDSGRGFEAAERDVDAILRALAMVL